jgi:hypothetical protein
MVYDCGGPGKSNKVMRVDLSCRLLDAPNGIWLKAAARSDGVDMQHEVAAGHRGIIDGDGDLADAFDLGACGE